MCTCLHYVYLPCIVFHHIRFLLICTKQMFQVHYLLVLGMKQIEFLSVSLSALPVITVQRRQCAT